MKKSLLFLASAIVMLSLMISCSQDDSDMPNDNINSSRTIGFKTFLDKNVTRGISTAAGALKQDFWTYAYYDSVGDRSTEILKPNFMYAQHVVYNDSTFTYSPTKYWPNTGDVNFYAWTPNTAANLFFSNPTSATSVGFPIFNYTVNSTIANQEDLLIAVAEDQDGTSGTVNLPFDHALTKVGFCARTLGDYSASGVTVRIMSITLSSIVNKGEFSYEKYAEENANTTWWTVDSSSKVNYAPDIRAGSTGRRVGYYGVNTYLELPDDNQFLLVMPQSFTGTDATITIVYKVLYSDGTSTQTFTKTVEMAETVNWAPGTYVNYAITISLNVVTFTGVVSDWNIINPAINIIPTDDDE